MARNAAIWISAMRQHLRPHLPFLALWFLLWAAFYATLLLGWQRLPHSDLTEQFHTFGLFQARTMVSGRLPLWSSGSLGGFPFAADPQAAVFYLPRWLTIGLSAPWNFPFYALEMEVLLHVLLAGTFTYAFAFAQARHHWAALIAGIAFALGGYLTSYPLLQLAILETITWLPLLLLLLHRATGPSARWRPLVGAGLVLALAVTAGHPQTALQMAYLAAAFYLFRAWRAGWSWRSILCRGAVFVALAAGGSAVSWLPTLQYTQMTTRAGVDYEFLAAGLPLLNFFQLLLPGLQAFWVPEYVGLVTLLLVLIAVQGWRQLEIRFWGIVVLVAGWLSLGDAGILFSGAFRLLPGFALFRQQERWLAIVSFGLAMLAAFGVALWSTASPAKQRRLLTRAGLMLAAGFVLTATFYLVSKPADPSWLGLWSRQLLMAALILYILYRRPRRQWLLLVMLLLADLFVGTFSSTNRQPGSPAVYWPQPAWLSRLQADEGVGRIDSHNLFWSNFGELTGLEDIAGISPLKWQALADYERLGLPRLWALLNVTHVILPSPPAEVPATLVDQIDEPLVPDGGQNESLFRLEQPGPRAWLSYALEVVPNPEAALARLADAAFDVSTQVLVPESVDVLAIRPPQEPPSLAIVRQEAGRLDLQVETAEPAILVLSEWAYPYWRISVDGRRAEPFVANGALLGVALPAGRHEVSARIVPYDVYIGLALSLITLATAAILLIRPPATQPARKRAGFSPRQPSIRQNTRFELSWRWTLVILFLFGFGLRTFSAATQELRGDEAFSYLVASKAVGEIIPTLRATNDPHSPLHYFLLFGWLRLAGDSELVMRLLTIWPSLLLIPLTAELGRQIAGRRTGLLAAALMTISQGQVWIGQDSRNLYALATCFGLAATLTLLRQLSGRSRHGRWLWLQYTLLATLTVYSHYFGIFVLLAHGLFLLTRRERRHLLAWLASGLAAALLFTPWLLAIYQQTVSTHLLAQLAIELAGHLTAVGTELATGSALPGSWQRWLWLAGLCLATSGVWALWRRRFDWLVLLGGWLLLAVWGIYLVRLRRPIFNDFYISVVAPAWWLLVSLGSLWLWRKQGWRRWLGNGLLLSLVLANCVALVRYYGDPVRYGRTNGYRHLAEHVAAEKGDNDVIIANSPNPSLSYYLRNIPLDYVTQPTDAGLAAEAIEADLAELAEQYDRLWFVPETSPNWDPERITGRWLDYHLLHEQENRLVNLGLMAYRRGETALSLVDPVAATWPAGIDLEGVFMTRNGRPISTSDELVLAPGDELALTLFWRPWQEVASDYTVFVHLLSSNGQLVAQHDGTPLFGTRPTSSWRPAELLMDRHVLTIPDALPERGNIQVGLYNPLSLDRLETTAGKTEVDLAVVEASQ